MLVSDFDFDLPGERIADSPVFPRDASRLLEVGDTLTDHHMFDFPSLLRSGDVLVFNDTKVIPARLQGRRGEARVEVTLHKQISLSVWKAFAKPAKRLQPGDTLVIGEDFSAQVLVKNEGEVQLEFSHTGAAFFERLSLYGTMPLPPYIRREKNGNHTKDEADYQTVYARHEGAVAAPTAGLHFTPELLERLRMMGVEIVYTTLHVGAGTYLPVKVEDTKDHIMHSEYGIVSESAAEAISRAKQSGRRIIAVGTTSLRLLETVADAQGLLRPFAEETDIFITPGYRFKCVDALLTNFHLPKSTLFMLVCAFAGTERMKRAYTHAIAQKYRFYSYGDACFLTKMRDMIK